jgi:hypothetical protein
MGGKSPSNYTSTTAPMTCETFPVDFFPAAANIPEK